MSDRWLRALASTPGSGEVALTQLPAPGGPEGWPSDRCLVRPGVCWWRGPERAFRLRLVGDWSFWASHGAVVGVSKRHWVRFEGDQAILQARTHTPDADLPYGGQVASGRWAWDGWQLWCDAGFAYLQATGQTRPTCLGAAEALLPGPDGACVVSAPHPAISAGLGRSLRRTDRAVEGPWIWASTRPELWGWADGTPVRIDARSGGSVPLPHPSALLPDHAQQARCFAGGIRCVAEARREGWVDRWTREGARLTEPYALPPTSPS